MEIIHYQMAKYQWSDRVYVCGLISGLSGVGVTWMMDRLGDWHMGQS